MKSEKAEVPEEDTVAIFFTGGTIAMKLGRGFQGVVPEVRLQSLMDLETFSK